MTERLPEDLAVPLASAAPRLEPLGRRVRWFASVGSTNDIAGELADAGEPEGTVIVADAQTAGRGRHGRVWVSPPAAGLYTSVILRPPARAMELITLAAGVALAHGLRAAVGLESGVKWPNDIYLGARKVAGILAEAGSTASGEPHVILGFGINLMPASLPPEVAGRATSLEAELGRPVDRGLILAECLAALSQCYTELLGGGGPAMLSEWRRLAAATFGRGLEWDAGNGVRTGVAEDVDAGGALLVRTTAGRVRIVSGEVRWTS